jgi:hypothetical protein
MIVGLDKLRQSVATALKTDIGGVESTVDVAVN